MNPDEKKLYEDQDISDHYDEVLKAKKKAREKILFETYYMDYKTRIQEGADPQTFREDLFFKEVRSKVKGTRNIAITGYWWFTFTVDASRFTDGTYLERLQTKVNKFTRKKCIKRAIWNFELTKEQMPHAHMLIEIDNDNPVAKHTFEKGFLNTFKDVGHVKAKKCPDEWVKDKIDYIKGIKWDEDKDTMIASDQQWRLRVGLQPYYEVGGWGDILTPPPPASESVKTF